MRKLYLLILLTSISCRLFSDRSGTDIFPYLTSTSAPTSVLQVTIVPTATASRIFIPPTPSPIPKQAVLHTNKPVEDGFEVIIHPDGPLYVGDQVSFEVVAPVGVDMEAKIARITLGESPEKVLGEQKFQNYGIGERSQATMLWAWDTSGLQPADYTLEITVSPAGPAWTETVHLFPQKEAPYPEPGAAWQTSASKCCSIHYITGTPAERDLEGLKTIIDDQYESISQRLGINGKEPIPITFLPRVIGHGGFASDGISLVYSDRNYSGSNLDLVITHELVHILDARINRGLRPTLFSEGLAVYLSGGHFKPEPLIPRAAALLAPEPECLMQLTAQEVKEKYCGLDWYLPLTSLVNDFYFAQHEISYLEAGALVEFMVNKWGWQAFFDFYTHINTINDGDKKDRSSDKNLIKAIDSALTEHFNITLDQLDALFINKLQNEALRSEQVVDVWVSVSYYEAVRRYQELLDPSAHFMTAWLPSGEQMRKRGIVADYLRKPDDVSNAALETLLISVDDSLEKHDFAQARLLLEVFNAVLDSVTADNPEPFRVHPLALDYLFIAQFLGNNGYNVNRIQLKGNSARVLVNVSGIGLTEFALFRTQTGWEFLHKAVQDLLLDPSPQFVYANIFDSVN